MMRAMVSTIANRQRSLLRIRHLISGSLAIIYHHAKKLYIINGHLQQKPYCSPRQRCRRRVKLHSHIAHLLEPVHPHYEFFK